MNKSQFSFSILFLLLFISISSINSAFSQSTDSTEFKQFKRILPFILKNLNADGQAGISKKEQVQDDEFVAPWDMKQFDESQIQDFVHKLKSDSKYEVKEAWRGDNLNLNIYSTLQDFRQEPELKKEFRNIIIELSNFNIFNEKGEDIYLEGNKNAMQPKQAGKQQITMQGAQFNCLIPISKSHTSLNGSVDLTIHEKSDFVFKEIARNEKPFDFNLNGVSVELLSIEDNTAYFKSDNKIDDLKMTSVNAENRKHNQTSILQLPESIYLKGKEDNLTEEGISDFVDKYSMEEFNNKTSEPTIIIYQSSGDIGKVYLFQITKMTERGKCTLNFKL